MPVLTVEDAARILPLLRGRPDLAAIVARLERAVNADIAWRTPVR